MTTIFTYAKDATWSERASYNVFFLRETFLIEYPNTILWVNRYIKRNISRWLSRYGICRLSNFHHFPKHAAGTEVSVIKPPFVNSLAPGRYEYDSKNVIFNFDLLIGIFRSSYDNALRWMPQDLTDDKSALVQVIAWCHQATSYYLNQCWLSSLSPYGVPRPQC